MVFNEATGTNYGYLNRKPPGASLLDLMPDWPFYVLIEIVLVTGIWALLTWPFDRARSPPRLSPRGSRAPGSGRSRPAARGGRRCRPRGRRRRRRSPPCDAVAVEDDGDPVGRAGVDQRAEQRDRVGAVLERQHPRGLGDPRHVGRRRAGGDHLVDHERARSRRPPRPRQRSPRPGRCRPASRAASGVAVDGLLDRAHDVVGVRRRGRRPPAAAAGRRAVRARAGRRCSGPARPAAPRRRAVCSSARSIRSASCPEPGRRVGADGSAASDSSDQPARDVAQRGVERGGERLHADRPQAAVRRPSGRARRRARPRSAATRICSPSSRPPPPLVTCSISSGLLSASSLR